MRIERGRLIEWLEEIHLPTNQRAENINRVIETVRAEYRGPYWDIDDKPTPEEILIIPSCVKLGIAVRLTEIEDGMMARPDHIGFWEEIRAASEFWGRAAIDDPLSVSTDPVFHDDVVPTLVKVGYDSVEDAE